ncbi:AAA family ATPase [Acinetobacter sp. WCHAc010052]|uniref:AAA family ATPase n=1 Tax=Acinetobacter sp. WCHAc010052 TaxID=2004647 RepID=UPI000B3CC302|nr:AAA family ATPase [Acinetobacter sp. WCHAc010052]AXY61159.1 restriction endonuclease [Acinetobacter sp. WCHAc010052]
MNNISNDIKNWLYTQKDWLQEAAERLLKNDDLTSHDINELVNLLKSPSIPQPQPKKVFAELTSVSVQNSELRLKSIGKISGIENLAPRQPLTFGTDNLVVIFGHNGSGKSSYSKIIKNISGKPRTSTLKGNVFKDPPASQNCEIVYTQEKQEHTLDWHTHTGPVDALRVIDIFDTDESQYYLGKENPISYTPSLVKLFEDLAKTCDDIKDKLLFERNTLISTLPDIPEIYLQTEAATQYRNLSSSMSENDVQLLTTWGDQQEAEIRALDDRLKSSNPLEDAKKIQATLSQLNSLIKRIEEVASHYNKQKNEQIKIIKRTFEEKKKQAEDSASIINGQLLKGVGSDVWKSMWEAARTYSTNFAYPTEHFPKLDSAKCVLCHQELSFDAQQRLSNFEKFVQGKLESDAKVAEATYTHNLNLLPSIPSAIDTQTFCIASGLKEDWVNYLNAYFDNARLIRAVILSEEKQDITEINTIADAIHNLKQHCTFFEQQITQLKKDAESFNRSLVEKNKVNLEMKRWISQQRAQIQTEVKRLKQIKQYDQWIASTNSRTISAKAGTVADALITESYVARFNQELQMLGAKHLKIELIKTKTAKGRPLHRLQLKAAKHQFPIESILSEGERRIITLAAFLADVSEKPFKAPFVFDDPISSLDQTWEERTIDRLIQLSQTRQVIVFTHRLSLLGMLSEKADSIHTIHIRQEAWGAGEAGEIPLYGKKPEAALKDLKGRRITQARKILETEGQELYYPLAKAICSDLRILTERIVEFVFLADVIQRHRRTVNTQGKIHKLAQINSSDCELIEEIMTKYSCYEHSQSLEAPVQMPEPNELDTDVDKLLEWHAEFSKRVA